MIYLDNSATTKPYPEVLASFEQVSDSLFANPSSIHQFGGKAENLLFSAKQQIAELLHVEMKEIIFTSGGTEGNNLAIKGIAIKHQNRGKHIITSIIEHPSVLEACHALEELGFEVTYLPVDEYGRISLEDVKNAVRDDTILITIMHVNNELGSIQPIREIGQIAKQYPKLFFHVDHVQGLGKLPLHMHEYGIDLCTMSGHKIHGLKGTGILYVAKHVSIFPLLHGGSQERSIRPGTENLAGIVAMAKALRLTFAKQEQLTGNLQQLRAQLMTGFEQMDGVVVNTPVNGAPHIVNISVPGLKPEVIIHALGEKDIFISTKAACSSKQADESRILAACGLGLARTTSALRISMSYQTTVAEITTLTEELTNIIQQLKEVME